MLDRLRKGASTGPAKVLFILLILSFGIWGIGDVVRGVGGNPAAIKVGDVEVSPQAVQAAFRQEVDRMRRAVGPEMTVERARELGLLDATIAQLARQAVVEAAAKDLGIVISDGELNRELQQVPAFRNAQGQFDRVLFARVLQQNNLNEERFLLDLERDMVRDALLGSAAAGAVAPAPLVAPLVAYQGEEREAVAVFIAADAQPAPQAPSDEALQEVYQDSLPAFTAPEYRRLTALVMRPSQLAERVEISDDQIRAEYDAHIEDLRQPETRIVQQVVVDDQQTAETISQAAQAGRTLTAAASEAGASPMDLGAVSRDGLPAEAADAVFTLPEGGVSAPVQTPFGWHVFQVAEIRAATTPALEDVRDDLRRRLAEDRAIDALYDVTAAVEDALGGGATLEEAAEQAGLPLLTVAATDRRGQDPQGRPVSGLPEEEQFLRTAFDLESGRESLLQELGQGYFIVRVDEVTPPTPRPFDSVREQVQALWQGRALAAAAEEQANAVAEALRAGTAPAAAAEGVPGAQVVQTPRFTRAADAVPTPAGMLPDAIVGDLFVGAEPGTVAVAQGDDGWVVARLTAVHPLQQPTEAPFFAQARRQVQTAVADDLATQFLNAYAERFGIEVNREVINRSF
ncbi:peptidylprolyl isomerase [Caenispirillum bisanense]|uniref:peptidylprolyl isomerase n=1 Tax=Caenispirillum bisanense TaxID=414052 RepID=UPI0031D76726